LSNISWIMLDKFIRLASTFVLVIYMARYLGPEKFGLLSYVVAFVGFFSSLSSLGLNGIVVRELINDSEKAPEILGSAFFLQILGSLCAILISAVTINYFKNDATICKLLVIVFSVSMFFKTSDIVKYWYEAKVETKYVVFTEGLFFVIFCVLKIYLVAIHSSLLALVLAMLIESIFVFFGLFFVYFLKERNLKSWHFNFKRARLLLSESWPLILSGISISIYMRIDQLMVTHVLGDRAGGIYSAAVKVSEVWYFIPIAIVSSIFPLILLSRKKNIELYYIRLQKLFDVLTIFSLIVSVLGVFLSSFLIELLFGVEYKEAAFILMAHIWTGIFVSLSLVTGNWLLLEGRSRDILYRSLLGAIINILGNLLLIPTMGAIGAAMSTIAAQAFVCFGIFVKRDKKIISMIIKSFLIHNSFKRIFYNL
jgi:O-antigen/teichoic acid export membrane protein